MKKYRCGKCGEIFVGKLEICPKCGTELHYLDQEVKKETETVKQAPKFHFEDEDVIKTGIEEEAGEQQVAQAAEAPQQVVVVTKPNFDGESYFDGMLIQLIGWRILGFLLTIITAFIGFPWAMCMVYRWETKHMIVSGYRLKFDGRGGQLFGRYLLWLLLTILTAGIFLIFLMIRVKKWKVKHTIIDSKVE